MMVCYPVEWHVFVIIYTFRMLSTGKHSRESFVLVTSLQLKNFPGLKGTDFRSRVISAYAASVKYMWKHRNMHYSNVHIATFLISDLHSYPGYRELCLLCKSHRMMDLLYSIVLWKTERRQLIWPDYASTYSVFMTRHQYWFPMALLLMFKVHKLVDNVFAVTLLLECFNALSTS